MELIEFRIKRSSQRDEASSECNKEKERELPESLQGNQVKFGMKIKTAGCAREALWGQTRMEGGEERGQGSPILPLPFLLALAPPSPLPTHISQGTQCAAAVMSISCISVSVARHHKGFVLPYGFLKVPRVSPQSGTWWTEPPPPGVSHVAHSKMTYTPSNRHITATESHPAAANVKGSAILPHDIRQRNRTSLSNPGTFH